MNNSLSTNSARAIAYVYAKMETNKQNKTKPKTTEKTLFIPTHKKETQK